MQDMTFNIVTGLQPEHTQTTKTMNTQKQIAKYRKLAEIAVKTNAPICAAKWLRKAEVLKNVFLLNAVKRANRVTLEVTVGNQKQHEIFSQVWVEVLKSNQTLQNFLECPEVKIIKSEILDYDGFADGSNNFTVVTCEVPEGTVLKFNSVTSIERLQGYFKVSKNNNKVKVYHYTPKCGTGSIHGNIGYVPYKSIEGCVRNPSEWDYDKFTFKNDIELRSELNARGQIKARG